MADPAPPSDSGASASNNAAQESVSPAPAPAAAPAATAPAPSTVSGTAILVLTAPWTTNGFVSGVEGWDEVTQSGTAGPEASADQVIALAAEYGVELERR